MADPAFVQVAADGAGKRIDNVSLVLPKGSIVTNADGSTTTLASDTVVFMQVIGIGDPDTNVVASVRGEQGRGAVSIESNTLERMAATLDAIYALLSI